MTVRRRPQGPKVPQSGQRGASLSAGAAKT